MCVEARERLSSLNGQEKVVDIEAAERLAELVGAAALETEALKSAVLGLEREQGREVYSRIIHVMAHLWFEPDEAIEHWNRITDLQAEMQAALGEPVDVRVALVRYFVNITRKITSPKVLEMEIYRRTEASVYRDELTGLHNFRYLKEHLDREIDLSRRHHAPVSVVMIDVDDFKHYNDRNGHLAGNDVLAGLAAVLRESVRGSDVAVRYGGEEFTLVLSATSKAGAMEVANRVREAIAASFFKHGEAQPGGRLTVSQGVSTYPADAEDATELLRKADSAMYLAKSKGKDLVCGYGQSMRSYPRIAGEVDGQFCELAGDFHRCRTLNISEGGILLVSNRRMRMGSLIDLRLSIGDGRDSPVVCTGRVVRVEETGSEEYRAAICIGEMSSSDRLRLSRFLGNTHSERPQRALAV